MFADPVGSAFISSFWVWIGFLTLHLHFSIKSYSKTLTFDFLFLSRKKYCTGTRYFK
jgi:hypothetical protein